jgi:hypothetical protein
MPVARIGSAQLQRRRETSGTLLDVAAGILSTAALARSAVKRYRGPPGSQATAFPIASSAYALFAGLSGRNRKAYPAAAGLFGTAFQLYNIFRRPKRRARPDLFYSTPISTQAALSVSGMLGLLASRTKSGRLLAGLTAAGLASTAREIRPLGSRHQLMYVPMTIPPLASVLLAAAAFRPRRPHPIARNMLRLTAAVGVIGSAFRVSRAIEGRRDWHEAVVDEPPLPARPGMTALALAGLAALNRMERHE